MSWHQADGDCESVSLTGFSLYLISSVKGVADASPVCASAPESGPLSYRRETTAELDELRRRVPPR